MNFRHDKYADRYRAANPHVLLAHNVTVAELIEFLSKLPSSMEVHSWHGDDYSNEIQVEPKPDSNCVVISG